MILKGSMSQSRLKGKIIEKISQMIFLKGWRISKKIFLIRNLPLFISCRLKERDFSEKQTLKK